MHASPKPEVTISPAANAPTQEPAEKTTVGSVDLNPKAAAGGRVSGTVSMNGVPADGEILAAYLYWEMISTNIAQVDGALFRGSPMTIVKASPTRRRS